MKINQLKLILFTIIQRRWETSKSGVTPGILGVAPTEVEKDLLLKVGETTVSHLTPLNSELIRIHIKGTGHFFGTLSVGSVLGTFYIYVYYLGNIASIEYLFYGRLRN